MPIGSEHIPKAEEIGQLDAQEKAALLNPLSAEWDTPIPFDTVKVPPFPIDCLPKLLKEYALAVSEDKQVPVDMPATGILTAMAACVHGKYKIEIKPGWIEPLNLYSLIIAASGEKKSAVLREITKYITQYESEYNETHKFEIAQNKKEKEMLYKELDDLTSRAAKGNSKNFVSKQEVFAKQREIEDFKDIKKIRLLADDTTPEALTSLLASNNGLISIISSEGGVFDTLNGRYSNSPNIDTFLKAYSGDFIRVDRKGREPEDIPSPCATILLTVQPDVLDGLIPKFP